LEFVFSLLRECLAATPGFASSNQSERNAHLQKLPLNVIPEELANKLDLPLQSHASSRQSSQEKLVLNQEETESVAHLENAPTLEFASKLR